ncbi:hypothetical protein GUJ93_ZPchr0008g11948 [Zizania palustris]|uniref:Uncharacterized protein n=1 Tax=Zizania palustris TaxID=103762 RepID=A0A8J5RXK6_ZIZPA|nr:hypothetical protein GUJ93_ZPchr0008g11948 [Zizania palustris]
MVAQVRHRGALTTAGERLVVEFRERAIKALDICNAAWDGDPSCGPDWLDLLRSPLPSLSFLGLRLPQAMISAKRHLRGPGATPISSPAIHSSPIDLKGKAYET